MPTKKVRFMIEIDATIPTFKDSKLTKLAIEDVRESVEYDLSGVPNMVDVNKPADRITENHPEFKRACRVIAKIKRPRITKVRVL